MSGAKLGAVKSICVNGSARKRPRNGLLNRRRCHLRFISARPHCSQTKTVHKCGEAECGRLTQLPDQEEGKSGEPENDRQNKAASPEQNEAAAEKPEH